MIKHMISATLLILGGVAVLDTAVAAESLVPEQFQVFDDSSAHTINYDDLTMLLNRVVMDLSAEVRPAAPLGTLISSSREGTSNRFFYEAFVTNEESRQLVSDIRKSLEQVPSEKPLKYFSRDVQLAYWLNLYNVTVLDEVIKVYPKQNLKKLLVGKKSILSQKLLNVEGVSLSLNDIQFTILKENYDNNPLIMYGLYQGVFGGPDIRNEAFTGKNVYSALEDNAMRFVNSNSGATKENKEVLHVSGLYQRNKVYFPDFEADLTEHLLAYLDGPAREQLLSATKIEADINNWGVTDLGGYHKWSTRYRREIKNLPEHTYTPNAVTW